MRSLAAGFRALGHGKLIFLLAAATVLTAAGSAAPLHGVFTKELGGTLAGDHFLRNHPTAAPTDFFDFLRFNAGAVTGVLSGSRYGVLLTILLQMFFAGGIVAVLGRGRFTFGQFFEPARRNFWHNAKCFFLFAVLLAVVLGALFGVHEAGKKIFEDVPPDATRLAAWKSALVVLAVLLWGVALTPLRLRPRRPALLSVDRSLARLGVRTTRAPELPGGGPRALSVLARRGRGRLARPVRGGLVDAGRLADRDRRALPPPVPRSLGARGGARRGLGLLPRVSRPARGTRPPRHRPGAPVAVTVAAAPASPLL